MGRRVEAAAAAKGEPNEEARIPVAAAGGDADDDGSAAEAGTETASPSPPPPPSLIIKLPPLPLPPCVDESGLVDGLGGCILRISAAISSKIVLRRGLACPNRWMRCTTDARSGAPSARADASPPRTHGCASASLALGRCFGSFLNNRETKFFASSEMLPQVVPRKEGCCVRMAFQIADSAGASGLDASSKGSLPQSSWYAMTPADHTSASGPTREDRTSGAMNQGVPSNPRSERGSLPGSKKAASPKSMALRGASGASDRSMKFPGFTSRWRIRCEWHWASVRRTARMKEATVISE